MNFAILLGLKVVLLAASVLYWLVLLQLIDRILGKPKLKKICPLLIGAVNTAVMAVVVYLIPNSVFAYLVLLLLMFVTFHLVYKDAIVRNLFCTVACILHVLAIRAIVVGVFSLASGYSPYEVAQLDFWFVLSLIVTLLVLVVVMGCVLVVVPLVDVRIINQHKEHQWFMIAWMSVNNIYLLINVAIFSKAVSHLSLPLNEIVAPFAILIGLYIVLFFAIKTSMLLGYKEKNSQLKQAVFQEQQYRNSITRGAVAHYEVNLSQNLILHGFEKQRQQLPDLADNFSDLIVWVAHQMIYSEDISGFVQQVMPAQLLSAFEQGKTEIILEYRRLFANCEYRWVRLAINMIKNLSSGDIVAFACVKDIDEEKRAKLELQYRAERDPLTGLYNKETTAKLINEQVAFSTQHLMAAFFMIDVDYFKNINDNFGHVYGDAVLCELSDKLQGIFQSDDIVGRIGGDEYVVYMKYGVSLQKIEEKAAAICKAFRISYKVQQGEAYSISASVGVSLFPRDGCSFDELYSQADVALYQAKNNGKNTYMVYDGSTFSGYQGNRTEIQAGGGIFQKTFKENRIEYVFKMLYQAKNPATAIYSVLELIANHFGFERGYVFEIGKKGKYANKIFEWCADGVSPVVADLQDVPKAMVCAVTEHFCKNKNFIVKKLADLPPEEQGFLATLGIKSMFQFAIFNRKALIGFIGFDNCKKENSLNDRDLDEMTTICNILADFFGKRHIDEMAIKEMRVRQEVMDRLDNYLYVINPETFEVLFMNEQTRELVNNLESTTPCYDFFRGNKEQCEDCPVRKLVGQTSKASSEIYNRKLDLWIETTASALQWTNGKPAVLVNCVDITGQQAERLEHINQLEKLVYVDGLTGGRTYHKFIKDAKAILESQPKQAHFLVKLDIDKFKLINQIYGYAKGDEVLCCVARAIRETLRDENEIFARTGNDEFIILCTLTNLNDPQMMYEEFLHKFYALMGDGFTFRCNFPHGRYIVQPGAVAKIDIKDMFEKVNVAHKVAKQDKTLDYVVYDESMTRDALYKKEIENKMEKALADEEFLVYLQPKYLLNTEKIAGAEALARWQNASPDLFMPSAFIGVFENNGFITKVDKYMLGKVCAIIRGWLDAGIEPVTVSVNFSRLHLNNQNLVQELCQIVDCFGIDHKYIEIEITETVIYDNIGTLECLLADFHKAGFTMAMDDFGSGYSSLGLLKSLPFDVIKMDRSFFVSQKDEDRSKIVVGSVIDMAVALGINIVAEGVEAKDQIDLLRQLHCDMAQGYYFAKPMPVDEFNKLMCLQQNLEKQEK